MSIEGKLEETVKLVASLEGIHSRWFDRDGKRHCLRCRSPFPCRTMRLVRSVKLLVAVARAAEKVTDLLPTEMGHDLGAGEECSVCDARADLNAALRALESGGEQ